MPSNDAELEWYRGTTPELLPTYGSTLLTGRVTQDDVDTVPIEFSTRRMFFQSAVVSGLRITLDSTSLTSTWSEFDHCVFTQKSKPTSSEARIAEQGSFGSRPSIYRSCHFVGVRFGILGRFSMGDATFEDCTFERCKFNGHFARGADLIRCRFIGKMDGCVWFGRRDNDPDSRENRVVGNDFSLASITSNVSWRNTFQTKEQIWPDDYDPNRATD